MNLELTKGKETVLVTIKVKATRHRGATHARSVGFLTDTVYTM